MALTEFEKLMKRANRILENADKMGLTNDVIETTRNTLKNVYKNMEKKNQFKMKNPKVFTRSKTLSKPQEIVFTNLAKELLENPQANLNQMFSKKNQGQIDKLMQEQGLKSKQEVLDFFDIMNRRKSNKLISRMLGSDQVKEMFDIAKDNKMTNKELTDIITEEIKKETRKQIQENGYIEETDDIAIAIRKRLRAKGTE